ncbi:MAG: polysaccharide deacetylase family protein, partial [Firmicutes bacterium]|nr:polysaccharide deacetylase family protein [Bacillota bacterium]
SGVCLPSSLGTLSFTLSYAALGSAQLLFPQAQTAAPAPTVSETPAHEISAPFSNAGIDPHQPMLALTFDDGPSKNTDHILDLLEQNGAHATFCVLGDLVGSGREAVLRAYTLGDEVIGHSWDHKDLTKLSYDQIASELSKTSAKLESVLGVAPPALFRPPYGAVNGAMKTVARDLGYAMIYWSVDTLDWKTKNTDAIYAAVMSGASDGAIILCHDRVGETADAMERAIPDLIAQGYQLVTVSELIENSGKAFEAGTVYYSGG